VRNAQWPKAVPCLFIAVTLACTPHRGPQSRPSASPVRDARPVIDTAPYWCDLVPKEALSIISGPSHDPAEFRAPTDTNGHSVCGVKDGTKYGPLGVTWDIEHGRELLAASRSQVAADRPRTLPVRLGAGFISYSPGRSGLPYEVAALFRCGSKEPWIYLALRQVSQGRDMTKDLVELMRVAQGRFGKLHRCSPAAVRWPGPGSG
jgi:hypothetical protein